MRDRDLPVEVLAHQHPEPGATAAAGLRGHLEQLAVETHRVVASHHPLLLATEDRIEINRPERDEGTREVARRARERRIVLGHELLGEIVVGRLAGPDRGHPELVDQAVLQRPIQPFAPPPRLRRVGRDVLGQRAPDLRQARLVHRALGLRRVERPVGSIRVEGHREPLGAQDGRQTGHDRTAAFARIERGMEHALGRIVGHRDQTRSGVRVEREPLVHAAVQVQQLPEAGTGLPAPAMPAPRLVLLDQPGGLQRLFHEAVGHRHPVLSPGNLMKVPHVEPGVALAIQPQHPLDLPGRHPTLRRAEQPLIDQPRIPIRFVALSPPPQRPRRPA